MKKSILFFTAFMLLGLSFAKAQNRPPIISSTEAAKKKAEKRLKDIQTVLTQYPQGLRGFEYSDLSNTSFVNIRLYGAMLRGTNFNNTDLSNADFQQANLDFVSFINAKLIGANLVGAYNLETARFGDADLTNAKITAAQEKILKGKNYKGTPIVVK